MFDLSEIAPKLDQISARKREHASQEHQNNVQRNPGTTEMIWTNFPPIVSVMIRTRSSLLAASPCSLPELTSLSLGRGTARVRLADRRELVSKGIHCPATMRWRISSFAAPSGLHKARNETESRFCSFELPVTRGVPRTPLKPALLSETVRCKSNKVAIMSN